jgi:hypothetical protein
MDYEDSLEGEILDTAEYNKEIVRQVLLNADYDADYLLEWGVPDFWKEDFWGHYEYVIKLFQYLIKKYSLNIPESCFDSFNQ